MIRGARPTVAIATDEKFQHLSKKERARLEKELGVDVNENFRKGKLARAGFKVEGFAGADQAGLVDRQVDAAVGLAHHEPGRAGHGQRGGELAAGITRLAHAQGAACKHQAVADPQLMLLQAGQGEVLAQRLGEVGQGGQAQLLDQAFHRGGKSVTTTGWQLQR